MIVIRKWVTFWFDVPTGDWCAYLSDVPPYRRQKNHDRTYVLEIPVPDELVEGAGVIQAKVIPLPTEGERTQ